MRQGAILAGLLIAPALAAAPVRTGDVRQAIESPAAAMPAIAESGQAEPPVFDLSITYTADIWSNLRGGIRRGERYLDNLDIILTVDAERALGWRGATLFAYALYNNGASFSGDLVGDAQTVSNIETGVRAARLYEAWIDQRLAGDRASLRFGLYDLNSEFDAIEAGSLSMLSSHGIGPDFAQSGRNGPSIFPVTSLALRADYRFGDNWVVRAAVLDAVPGDAARPRRTTVRLSGDEGALLVGEVNYQDDDTKIGVGAWQYTSRFERLEAPPASAQPDAVNRGVYMLVERRLIRAGLDRPGSDAIPGLAGWVRIGFAEDRVNPISRYLGGGLVYTGLLRAERDDRLGIAVAWVSFGRPYRRAVAVSGGRSERGEAVVELTYRTPLTSWLTIQPNVQYVINPSGDPVLRNALVAALRFEIGF